MVIGFLIQSADVAKLISFTGNSVCKIVRNDMSLCCSDCTCGYQGSGFFIAVSGTSGKCYSNCRSKIDHC